MTKYSAGALVDIRYAGHEVWHGMSFVFRDQDWWTPQLAILREQRREIGPARFDMAFEGAFATNPEVAARVSIEGTGDGAIRCEAEAEASGDIAANRLGLCLLYPLSLAGAPCEILHDDGRVTRSTFPTLVPPWPPFMQIAGVRHRFASGAWATAAFAGDSFEFEDQRNNCDASFKIYSRSNMAPRPFRLRGGRIVRQAIELRVETPPARPRSPRRDVALIEVAAAPHPAPAIGIAISPGAVAAPQTRMLVDALAPSHLHLTLDGGSDDVAWRPLADLLRNASAGLRIDLTVEAPHADTAFEALAARLADAGIEPRSIAIFPSDPATLQAARARLPGVRIGGGTPHFLVQLMRSDEIGEADFLTFTTSPLVHGASDGSVMLSLRSLPGMIETLRRRRFAAGVQIGPSAIAMRESPLGRQPRTDGKRRIAMAKEDPRARGLFGAAWALGYIAQCAACRVEAVTLMALDGPSAPAEWTGEGFEWRPVAAVLAELGPQAQFLDVAIPDGADLAAVAFLRNGRRELMVANLAAAPIDVAIRGWPLSLASVLDVDAVRRQRASGERPAFERRRFDRALRLDAYALAHFTEENERTRGAPARTGPTKERTT
ncbi:MAG: hypothetical protein KGM42_13570 [Hyphomicrobiales bacterium]|nr:hypothetical protein [Hyphomicrobiales bacterium]